MWTRSWEKLVEPWNHLRDRDHCDRRYRRAATPTATWPKEIDRALPSVLEDETIAIQHVAAGKPGVMYSTAAHAADTPTNRRFRAERTPIRSSCAGASRCFLPLPGWCYTWASRHRQDARLPSKVEPGGMARGAIRSRGAAHCGAPTVQVHSSSLPDARLDRQSSRRSEGHPRVRALEKFEPERAPHPSLRSDPRPAAPTQSPPGGKVGQALPSRKAQKRRRPPGTVSRNNVSYVVDDMNDVPAWTIGEIVTRSSTVMRATSRTRDRGGR